jgi:hypothetical protein
MLPAICLELRPKEAPPAAVIFEFTPKDGTEPMSCTASARWKVAPTAVFRRHR